MKSGIRIVSDTISPKLRKVDNTLNSRGKEYVRKSLRYGKKKANSYAPVKTSRLRNGIGYRTYTKKARGELFSIANNPVNGFPYNRFVNKDIAISIKRRNRFFARGQTFFYGAAGVVAPSGRPVRWQKPNTIGFMNQAFLDMKRHFWSDMRNFRKELFR